MKKVKSVLVCFFFLLIFSCKKEKTEDPVATPENVFPETFAVDVPSAMSSSNLQARFGFTSGAEFKGNDIYKLLRVFINIGENSANFVQTIMGAIRQHHINKPMTISFTGKDDGRMKALKVIENASYNGTNYQFRLTLKDQDSSIAMQVFWNKKPIKGIAILCPKNMNRNEIIDTLVKYRVDYSEAEPQYEKRMIVSISGLPKKDKFSINCLKLFVGKTGDMLDIFGNSNHPDITLIDSTFTGGRNWAFVAHASNSLNIGIAKVGLPPSSLSSNTNIFSDFSIYKVLEKEIKTKYPNVDSTTLADLLKEAKEPGYFVSPTGFVSSGSTVPANSGFTATFKDLSTLNPYIPSEIASLKVDFQR